MMVSVNNPQLTCVGVEGKLIRINAELHLSSDKSRHFSSAFRSIMSNGEVLRYEVLPRQQAANSQCSKHAKFNLMSVRVPWNAGVTQSDNDPVSLWFSQHKSLLC